MQRMLDQALAEGLALVRVGGRQRHATTHAGQCAHGVPGSRHVQHRGNQAHTVIQCADRHRIGTVKMDFRRGQLARAELVLELIDANAVPTAIRCMRFQVEHGKRMATGSGSARSRKRQCHVADHRGREPLAPRQSPMPVAILPGLGFGVADVRATGQFRHPLAGKPECRDISGSQARNCVCDQCVVGGGLERGGGAIGHGQRAGVELAGDVMQVDTQELVATRVFPVACLVSCGDQAVAGGDFGAALPHRGGFDAVNAIADGIKAREDRLRWRACAGFVPGVRRMRAQRIQIGIDFAAEVLRHVLRQPGLQDPIAAVLVFQDRHFRMRWHAQIIDRKPSPVGCARVTRFSADAVTCK